MLSTGVRTQRQPKATACVHCRQMKLKCDKLSESSEPCTRCAKRKISCSVDPTFRRMAKRDRLETMERELRDMKRILGLPSQGSVDDMSDRASSIIVANPSKVTTPSSPSIPLEKASLLYLNVLLLGKSLEGVYIDAFVIRDLLDSYYQNCHPLFPVLPQLETFIITYDSCPLLFWTVMAVSSKGSKAHSELYTRLIEPVRRLAGEVTKIENRSVGFVQALLLLCCWPFPFDVSISDTSWMLCGFATHMALQLGLHRPHHQTEFAYRPYQQPEFGPNSTANGNESSIQRLVWVGCYIVNHSISGRLGVPATITFDNTILEAITLSASIPASMYHQLQIANINARISKILGQNEQSSSGLQADPIPLIRIFNEELGVLASQHGSSWEPEIRILFICARLRLYSFAFMQDTVQLPGAGPVIGCSNAEFCTSAYSAALELTTIACSRSYCALFWTAEIWNCTTYAAMFLLRLGERSQVYGLDEARIRSAITQLRDLIAKHSTGHDDHMSRVCAIIDYLSKDSWDDGQHRRPVKFQSRMASNLPFDTVWHAKERFNLAREEHPPNNDMTVLDIDNWMFPYWEETAFPDVDALGSGI